LSIAEASFAAPAGASAASASGVSAAWARAVVAQNRSRAAKVSLINNCGTRGLDIVSLLWQEKRRHGDVSAPMAVAPRETSRGRFLLWWNVGGFYFRDKQLNASGLGIAVAKRKSLNFH